MTDTTTTAPAAPSTRDRLKAAKFPEKTVDICLRGDLQSEWEDLHRQLADVETAAAKDKRLNGDKRAREIAEQITAVQDQMHADTLVFRLRGLPKKQWDKLLKEHPPRKDNTEDAQLGYNVDTFMAALIRTCTYSPDDLDDEGWAELLEDVATEWQFAQLQDAALAVNVRKINVPNSFAASQILRPSARG